MMGKHEGGDFGLQLRPAQQFNAGTLSLHIAGSGT